MLLSLKTFDVKRPERITWIFPISSRKDFLNNIKSKSLKLFLKNVEDILSINNIHWTYEDLTREKFLEWLPFYQAKMEEHGFDVRAKEEWYAEEQKKGH